MPWLLGISELHTQDKQLVVEILDYLNTNVGAATVYDVYSGDVVSTIFEWLLNVPFLLGILLLTLLLLLFALMRYSIHESRTVVILDLNGFGKCRILLFHARVLLPCCLCGLLLNMVGVAMVLLFGMVQATDTLTVLNGQYTANSVWKQVENVYRVKTKFVTDDSAAEHQLQHKAASDYQNDG